MPWMRAILSVARRLPRQLTLVSPAAWAATVACRVVALCREPGCWHGPPRQLTPASPAAHAAAAACHAVSRSRHAASPSACGNTAVELASLAAWLPHLALTVLHASLLYCTNGRTPKRRRHDGEQVHGHKEHMTEDVSKLCEELTSKEDWHRHTRLRTTICSKGAQNYVGMLPGFPLVSHNVSGINWSFHVPLNTARGSR